MSTRTTVVWVPDWPVVAAVRSEQVEPHLPAAVHDGRRVTAVSALARAQGVRRGMRRRQAQGCCPELVLLAADEGRDVRLFEPVAAAVETVVAGIEVARAGLLLLPAGGAARYHGTEEVLAERLVAAVARQAGDECHVGTADGLLAAVLAARTDGAVPPGRSREFLARRGVEDLVHAAVQDGAVEEVNRLVDLFGRLGLRRLGDLAALPTGDVHARFGTWGTWAHTLARGEDLRPPARRRPEADLEVSCALDPPAERVDIAAFAGRRLAEELHTLLTERSAMCGRLLISARTDTGEVLARTWRTDLGGLGGLSTRRITDRIRWQLEGWLTAGSAAGTGAVDGGAGREAGGGRGRGAARDVADATRTPAPAALVHLSIVAQEVSPAGDEQGQLWGGPSGGDLRAHRALDRVQGLVGGDGVLTATLQGGRDVRDQVHLRAWGEQTAAPRPVDRPWPGRLPDPAPATVPLVPEPVELLDAHGAAIVVDDRFELSAEPAAVRRVPGDRPGPADGPQMDGVRARGAQLGGGTGVQGAWVDGTRTGRRAQLEVRTVVGWAGPWPLVERWWSAQPRRLVHVQVALDDGQAWLLAHTATGWTREASYD
ncbi:DNA polymerase Y family protein [Cellulomonas hominis]